MVRQWWVALATYLVSFYSKEVFCRTTCSINLNTEYRASEEPLFLSPDGARIVYPNNRASIEVHGGDKLRVYCGHKNFKELKSHSDDSLLVQCNSGKSFKLLSPHLHNAQSVQYSQSDEDVPSDFSTGSSDLRRTPHSSASLEPKSFACSSIVRSAIRPGKPCGLRGREEHHQEFSIGFPISKGFLPIISVCFNTELKSVLWSRHVVSPTVEYHMSKVPRITFIQDRIPYDGSHLNVDKLYNRHQEIDTIAAILGSKDLAEKYIEPKGNGFFARGHLAPKGDFVYAGEQLATFHFINVAPQWQYFNGGQWEKIESTLRNYVIRTKVQARVLTLSLGITQLQDEEGEDRDIYLYYNQRTRDKLIKVPKLYAKIINFGNSSASSKSVVIVGVNQPFESHVKMSTNDIICPDVCDRYEWIAGVSQHNDQHHSSGYIYCCTPSDFISYLQSGQGYKLDSAAAPGNSDSHERAPDYNAKAESHGNRFRFSGNVAFQDGFGLNEPADSNNRFGLNETPLSYGDREYNKNTDSLADSSSLDDFSNGAMQVTEEAAGTLIGHLSDFLGATFSYR